MWIPEQFDPSATYSLRPTNVVTPKPHFRAAVSSELDEWSSIIGIVTAIIGNVLISFALNIQRYAHIRLDREYHQLQPSFPSVGDRTDNDHRAYGGIMPEQIVEERTKINAKALGPRNADNGGTIYPQSLDGYQDQDAHETSPLLKRYDSDSTLTTLEKRSEDGDGRKSYLRSPYWWAGIILMTVGEAGNFLAYGFAPASIVSPLGVVALISNCIIAPFMLKERFRTRDGWGVLVAIGGAVTVVLSAKTSETKLGQDELLGAILRWEFLTYVGITAAVIFALMFASPRYGDRTILIDLGLVGLFGGYTALSTKGVASLLSDTLWMALTFPITYFLVGILVLSALMQIRYVNRALQCFDSTQVIPTQFVLFTISVIIGSAVLYRDFESTTVAQAVEFVGGCLLTFSGVYLITSGRHEDSDREEGDGTDQQEGIRLLDEEAEYHATRLPRRQTIDGQISPSANVVGPQIPDHPHSDPETPTTSSVTQTPSTPSASIDRSTTDSNRLGTRRERDKHWVSASTRPAGTSPFHSERTVTLPAQPSPFTRAQSGSPQTPSFARLRPTQSHQQTPTSPTKGRLDVRSSSTPTVTDPRTPTTESRGSSPQRTAEAALRANLSPSPGQPEPAIPSSGYPPLNRASRGSFGRLLPGPLLSPLSSSLSAVVADSLRRGEGTGTVAGLGLGRSRGRLSGTKGVRRKSTKRPSVIGMANDGVAPGSPVAERQRDDHRHGLRDAEEGGGDNEVGRVVGGGGSVEGKQTGFPAISQTLGGLVGRRKEQQNGSTATTTRTGRSRSSSGGASPPPPSPSVKG